jgi:phosphoglycerate dehydrogenase-like enzyme
VDTDALLAELTSGRLSAAVDVTDPEPLPADHPLWDAPNLLVSPHVGGASSAMWPRAQRLLPDADVVILIVPLTAETRGLVDADFLARMKDGALLVNVARGPVVDTDALLAELTSGRLSAAVDVTDPEPLPADHPLWDAPNLLVSPHVGGASSAMWPRAHRLVRDQLHRFADGDPLANVMEGEY